MKKHSINLYTVLTIIWIIIIFSFSLQSAEASSELSSGLGRSLIEFFFPKHIEQFEAMPEEQLSFLHQFLRKFAHFTEYFILGVLVFLSKHHAGIRRKFFIAIVICMLVASVDESIQLFVSGRSGELLDVLLDTGGATIGCLLTKKFIKE